jgi:thiol-disulfide isomerase/thioredoxin
LLRIAFACLYLAAAGLATPGEAQTASGLEPALLTGTVSDVEPVDPAPPAAGAFRRADGTAGSLADYLGDVVVLNFWATWCAPCRVEMPSLQALQDRLGPEGLSVVTVAFGRHNPVAMEEFWDAAGITSLPLHIDPAAETARALGVRALPHTFLLDRQGRVVGSLEGEAHWDAPEAVVLLRDLLER